MSVLVTVVGSRAAADLELDDARPVRQLLKGLETAVGEPSHAVGLRTSDGTDLSPDTTLDHAGVLDGHCLTLVPASAASGGAPVLACYLVLDTSDSMAGPALDAVNVELARIVDALRSEARLTEACQLAVITFDAEARLHLPLTPISDIGRAPRFAATRPATNYEEALRLLRRQIADDVGRLRSAGRRPLRPLVFLLTDGRPTRGHWPAAHAELTDSSRPDVPDIVVFGFGEASSFTVRRIATAGAYLPASAAGAAAGGPAGMVAAFMAFLVETLHGSLGPPAPHPVAGWASDAGDEGDRMPPGPPRGWRSLDEVRR
jgi:uncharacterized protein YegL